MNPIFAALATSPAVGAAAQQAIRELTPVVKHALKHVRPGFLAPIAGPTLLVGVFTAGVAVGWFTAPRKGVVMRRKVIEAVNKAYSGLGTKASTLGQKARQKEHEVRTWARAHGPGTHNIGIVPPQTH